jgi:hypothetical protein
MRGVKRLRGAAEHEDPQYGTWSAFVVRCTMRTETSLKVTQLLDAILQTTGFSLIGAKTHHDAD